MQATASSGKRFAASCADPRATQAALEVLAQGGSAVDAAIAAHLVLAVCCPHATGIGGDLLALVAPGTGDAVVAVNGTGPSARRGLPSRSPAGASVTVPGLLAGCKRLHEAYGRLSWGELFTRAIEYAAHGIRVSASLAAACRQQRARLSDDYRLTSLREGDLWQQPELADCLDEIARRGVAAFYSGSQTAAIVRIVKAAGGSLGAQDFKDLDVAESAPIQATFRDSRVWVQPAPSQGVLLAMALQWLHDAHLTVDTVPLDHFLIEATNAAFEHRDEVGAQTDLLDVRLTVDRDRATPRRGPRAYLHTAGVAVVDSDGTVVSSLSSVFDDFGSGLYVPELGVVLNNRGEGFTAGSNAPKAGAYPVHTLAPSIVRTGDSIVGLATPGADGQVQVLLQVLNATHSGVALADAISAPRWRSQDGSVYVELSMAGADIDALKGLGHRILSAADGADMFGAVVAAGTNKSTRFAVADWRRDTHQGAH